jgi:hypothetical protein
VDLARLVALDKGHVVAVTGEHVAHVVVTRAAQDGRARDLVAVEMEDRQHGTVARRVQEVDALPAAGERSGLGLAVAHHRGDDEVGVVERRAEGVDEHVAELAALVNRSRCGHADVARNPARRRELPKQPAHPRHVPRHVGVDLRVRAFEIDVSHDRRPAVPGAGQIDDVGVVLLDEAIQVHVEERLSR